MRIPSRLLARSLSTTAPTPSSSSAYTPPLAPGVLPAYDQALLYLSSDRTAKLESLEKLRAAAGSVGAGEGQAEAWEKRKEMEKLEVDAWVNDPETRWRSERGLGDMSKPIYRHLAERAWRKDGNLDRLMQRVTQMNVTPDLIASISPSADVRVSISGEDTVPGVFVLPSQTKDGITVSAQVFHPEERLYTLLLVDPDVPDEENHSFTTFAHWLIPNIPLSSTVSSITAPALLPYIPPHPQQGTPYHRYTVFLFAQSSPLTLVPEAFERTAFSTREFVAANDLKPAGVHFFRELYEAGTVAQIYEEMGEKMPRFGRERRRDPYKEPRDPKYQFQ